MFFEARGGKQALARIKVHGAATGVNRIIMFKSCYPASDVDGEGAEPADPFSDWRTLANYRALYRHSGGTGNVYSRDGTVYRPL